MTPGQRDHLILQLQLAFIKLDDDPFRYVGDKRVIRTNDQALYDLLTLARQLCATDQEVPV